MKFKLGNVQSFYDEGNKYMELLKTLGFVFELCPSGSQYWVTPRSENTVEINTLEELLELVDKVGNLIIDKESITIYDDYIE